MILWVFVGLFFFIGMSLDAICIKWTLYTIYHQLNAVVKIKSMYCRSICNWLVNFDLNSFFSSLWFDLTSIMTFLDWCSAQINLTTQRQTLPSVIIIICVVALQCKNMRKTIQFTPIQFRRCDSVVVYYGNKIQNYCTRY